METFQSLVSDGEKYWQSIEVKDTLRGLLMTACDVAAITKPWEIQKRVAELVTKEFFEQGDREKIELKEKPIAIMDRERVDELPKMQVNFIDYICLPVYKVCMTWSVDVILIAIQRQSVALRELELAGAIVSRLFEQ